MPSYDYSCLDCNLDYVESRKYDDRDVPGTCEVCGKGTQRTYRKAPSGMFAAFPDGHKRGGSYELLKEASKLEVESAQLKPTKRKEIQAEISKLKSTKETPK